jgi:hypothetical protein
MRVSVVLRSRWGVLLFGLVLALPAGGLAAQTSTGSIRGTVTDSAGSPLDAAQVTATNVATNIQRGSTSNARGFYSLSGLTPGSYRLAVRHIGHAPAERAVTVQVGQVLTLDFPLATTTVELQEVVVQAAPVAETNTSENATNVTREQIENLPTSSRNFLDLAGLAPGVRFNPDRINGANKSFAAGALPADNINVFVDGHSLKNDITVGGIVGQDASRGNPFPRNAVQEFRVVTNNFKAEYQKASSAIITAATKSGGNTWQGSVFTGYQNRSLVALDTFQLAIKEDNPDFEKPDYSRVLTGLSAGGPVIRDRLFFFGAYEGNYQNRQGVTRFNGDPATWPAAVAALEEEAHTSPFRSSLGFAKLSFNQSEKSLFELTGNIRRESDRRRFGGQFGDIFRAFEAGESIRSNVFDGGLKHTYYGQNWINEALVSYQWYQFNQEPFNFNLTAQEDPNVWRIGGGDSRQDLIQKRLSIRNDWTYSGFQAGGSHVIKLGGNLDFLRYNLTKQLNENPIFRFNLSNNYAFPVQAEFGFGEPEVDGTNNQLGIYVQDDWSPTPRLTINAGIRWDYESGMYNRDYVTPQAARDSILLLNDSMFVPVDPARYFTDGNDRKAFTGAFQPRVGLSYAVDAERRTNVFAGFGIFYDRFGFNSFLDETYRAQHPNLIFNFTDDPSETDKIVWDPSFFSREGLEAAIASGVVPRQEIFFVPNDLKPPKTYQFSGGVRQQFGDIFTSVTYTGVRGRNGFSFEWGQLTLNPATNDCCISISTPYQNILVGNNTVRTWYDAVELKVDRPYHRSSEDYGWGAGISYALSWADQEGGDLFSFPQITAGFNPRHPIADDQRHRVVANFVTDVPFAFGIQFSGLIQVASGKPFNIVSFVGGTGTQRVLLGFERGPTFKNVDLRLRKDFPNFGGTRLGITGDLFNVFNWQNLGGFDDVLIRGDGTENDHFGHANQVISDPRRFQLGFQYDF